jgi:HSP20 family protein
MSVQIEEKKSNTEVQSETKAQSNNTRMERVYTPLVNITETEKEIYVHAEMPGVAESDIDLSIEKGILSLEGRRRNEDQSLAKSEHVENFVDVYKRKFQLGKSVDVDQTKAELTNGILKITMLKIEPVKKKIEIRST